VGETVLASGARKLDSTNSLVKKGKQVKLSDSTAKTCKPDPIREVSWSCPSR